MLHRVLETLVTVLLPDELSPVWGSCPRQTPISHSSLYNYETFCGGIALMAKLFLVPVRR